MTDTAAAAPAAPYSWDKPPAGTVVRGESCITWTIPREYLTETLELPYGRRRKVDGPKPEVIRDEITEQSRWSTYHELLFRMPGQPENEAWLLGYERGSTEYQDDIDWFDDATGIQCELYELTPTFAQEWKMVDPRRTRAPELADVIRGAAVEMQKAGLLSDWDIGQLENILGQAQARKVIQDHIAAPETVDGVAQ